MYNKFNTNQGMIVELNEKIFARTIIPKTSHPALRSGFAGYPVNPRWNIYKYHAWKTGYQWRNELNNGDKVVRKEDSMLVPLSEINVKESKHQEKTLLNRFNLITNWAF